MARLDIPFLIVDTRSKKGARYYWQPSTELRKLGWRPERLSDDLAQAINRAKSLNAELEAWRNGETTAGDTPAPAPKPDSLSGVIVQYRQSRFFTEKALKTRRHYEHCLRAIEKWAGDKPVAWISADLVQDFYDAMLPTRPASANAIIRVLRILMQFAVRKGLIKLNPAAKPGLIGRPPSGRLWPFNAVLLMVEAADREGCPSLGTAVLVNWWIGQRQGDILHMKRSAYRDGRFWIIQRKTGARVAVPHSPLVAQRVEAELERQRQANEARKAADLPPIAFTHLVVSETTGQPYKEDHFHHLFARIREKAAAIWPAFEQADETWLQTSELQFMHLRHTAVTELAQAGCSTEEIAAISGHTMKGAQQILERYLVRTTSLAENAMKKRLAKTEDQ